MHWNNHREVYFHFGDYGWPEYILIEQEFMQFIFDGAERLIEKYSKPANDLMLREAWDELIDEAAVMIEPNDEWITTAMLVTCMRGLLYGKLPDIFVDD